MKSFIKEFKEFISRGSVMDMAVGIIIGGAFTAIVNSLVADILNPILGLFAGKGLEKLSYTIGECTFKYGSFLSAVINFLLIALVLFTIIKAMNRVSSLKKTEEVEEAPTTKVCPYCKSEVAIDATRCPHCTSELAE